MSDEELPAGAMSELDYIDRADWLPGPWDGEPDREEWRSGGYACLVVRSLGTGALCGYVGVTPGHPWHGKPYQDLDDVVQVHGGLTYSDKCRGRICHVPQEGESDDVYWLGFDCSHFQDISPKHASFMAKIRNAPRRPGGMLGFGTYKDMAYVKREVEFLRAQAEAARTDGSSPFPKWPEEAK